MSVTEEERQLYEELRKLDDFDSWPIPARWFTAFNIPPRKTISPAEYMRSNYAMKCAFRPKNLPTLVIKEPQQNGKLVVPHPPENIPVEVIQKPFELTEIPDVLPTLQIVKDEVKGESHH